MLRRLVIIAEKKLATSCEADLWIIDRRPEAVYAYCLASTTGGQYPRRRINRNPFKATEALAQWTSKTYPKFSNVMPGLLASQGGIHDPLGFLILRSLPEGEPTNKYMDDLREHLHQRLEDILHVAEEAQDRYPEV